MKALWPPVGGGIQDPPEQPELQQLAAALRPLAAITRAVTFESGDTPRATLCFGSEAHMAGLHVFGDVLQIDLPVGEIPHTAQSLHHLLMANHRASWMFRVDSLGAAPDHMALVVVEQRFPRRELEQLPQWILAGWRQKLLAGGLLQALGGSRW